MTIRKFFAQFRSWRLHLLVVLIIALTITHQSGLVHDSPFRQILDIVPYLLIILGAVWFGLPGGITCALVTSLCFITHLYIHEGGGLFDVNLHRTLNIAMFNVVGVVTGLLAERRMKAMAGYRKVAAELKTSYAELRDKTEDLFEAEEHLIHANRLAVMGELTAELAHEIGNPLGGIKGAAEILADGIEPDDGKHRFARLLLKEVARLDSVVSRFLESVRPHEAPARRADLAEVVNASVSLCRRALDEGRLNLEVDIEDGLPPVRADPHHLEQVFLNLLLNAIQATPAGGSITLRAHHDGDTVQCDVVDSGCGIDPKIQARVFDPFFTGRTGGTGLGLAITHKLLESCQGRIRVDSEPGKGATFTVTLRTHEEDSAVEESTHSR